MNDLIENPNKLNNFNNKKPVAPSKVNTGSELQSNHNTGEFHMNSTNNNYTNITQNSPSDNLVDIRPSTHHENDSTLIKEGIYEAILVSWETSLMQKSPKIVMYFKIIEFGEHLNKMFPKYYYVKKHKGKPCKRGQFIAKSCGHFLEQWYKIFPDSTRLRLDRIPMQNLLNKPVKVKIKTVKRNSENSLKPKQMYYSKVDEIMPI